MSLIKSSDKRTRLYVIFSPIGNLDDISLRAIKCLKDSDIVVCENSRRTLKLLNHFDVKKKIVHINPNHEDKLATKLINLCQDEDKIISLLSDAGAPAISDPGKKIIDGFIKSSLKFEIIPGASAPFIALLGSGFNTKDVYFGSFLPIKSGKKLKVLNFAIDLIKNQKCTCIYFESPHRILKTIELLSCISINVKICIARELTKKFEEFIRGTPSEILEILNQKKIKGEITLVLS